MREIVHLTPKNLPITTRTSTMWRRGRPRDLDLGGRRNGRYPHFMEKEIFEQPIALENAMRGRFSEDQSTANFGGINLTPR